MEIPALLVIFSIPTLVYIVVQRLRGRARGEVFRNVGWVLCSPGHYLWALGVFVLVGALAWLAFRFIPPELVRDQSAYSETSRTLSAVVAAGLREAFYVALGEEIFFRGLLAGWLIRKLRFRVGNLAQAALFLLPHLLLLTVDVAFWPILIVQFVAGWLQGWLRYRSDSILPGWLVHTLSNTASAISAMS